MIYDFYEDSEAVPVVNRFCSENKQHSRHFVLLK